MFILCLWPLGKIRVFSDALAEFNTLTLFEQFRLLFTKGMEFARMHPLYAALGEQFSKEHDESAKSAVIKAGNNQSESLFMQMIQNARIKVKLTAKSIWPLFCC